MWREGPFHRSECVDFRGDVSTLRITEEWLAERGACEPAVSAWRREIPPGGQSLLECAEWCLVHHGYGVWHEWLYAEAMRGLPHPVVCGLAAAEARSVQHLWPEAGRVAC